MLNTSGYIKEGNSKPLKYKDMEIKGLGLTPVSYTTKDKLPQCDQDVIRALAGADPENGEYGLAYEEMCKRGQTQDGIDMSVALSSWLKFKSIEKL